MTFIWQEQPYVGEKHNDVALVGVRMIVVGAPYNCGNLDKQTRCRSDGVCPSPRQPCMGQPPSR